MTRKRISFALIFAGLVITVTSAYSSLQSDEVVKGTVAVKTVTLVNDETSSKTKTIARLKIPESQTILLEGPIFDVHPIVRELKDKAANGKDLYILIDSPGGSVLDGSQIISEMEASPVKIHTICTGMCASMAFMIHQFGKTRLAVDRSVLMAHPASGGVQGTLEQMQSRLNMITKYVDKLNAIVASRLPMPFLDFKRLIVSEFWVDAEDAVGRNLVDEIVTVDAEHARNSLGIFGDSSNTKKANDLIWM